MLVTAPGAVGNKLSVTERQPGSVDLLVPFSIIESTFSGTLNRRATALQTAASGQSAGLVQIVFDAADFEATPVPYDLVDPPVLMPCDQIVDDEPRCLDETISQLVP